MPTFPRTKMPFRATDPRARPGLMVTTQQGPDQGRSTTARGVRWTERWRNLRAGDPDVEALLAFIRRHHRKMTVVDATHPNKRGSGKAPLGTGASGITVSGADQTGSSIQTTGWTANETNVVREGDVIRIAGIDVVFEITADANADSSGNATLQLDPSILEAPTDGASVTTTGVLYKARIVDYEVPEAGAGEIYGNLEVVFKESP